MTDTNVNDAFLYACVFAPIVILCAAAFYVNVIRPFSEDRKDIKSEMRRSYTKEEFRYWERELKKLYVSRIPVFGKLIAKHIR